MAPGAWAPQVLADLGVPMTVTRELVFWFEPSADPASYEPGRQPIFIWERPSASLYGFPCLDGVGRGAKIGLHRHGLPTDPDALDREVAAHEVEEVAAVLRELVPTLPGTFLRSVACLYTTTPDQDFVIGRHPEHPNVTVACGFSGHGFKFVPVVGEVLADLALEGATRHPIGLFEPTRFR